MPFIAHAQLGDIPYAATSAAALQEVDIIIEADTFVPAFYKGRREPSTGSRVRAIAVLNNADQAGYRYQWEVGNGAFGGGQKSSGNVVTFSAPLGDQFLIRVDVFNSAGTRIASNQRYVSISEPEAVFYEDSLLRGTAENAVRERYTLVGEEVSIRAVPYFMDRNIFSGKYDLGWKINGEEVTGMTDTDEVITLRNNGGSGTFPIEFALRNAQALTQYVQDKFSITF